MFKLKQVQKFSYLIFIASAIGCFSNNAYENPVKEQIIPKNNRRGELPPNAEPGKCYAQYFEPQFHIDRLKFFEYVGDDFEQTGLEKREIEVRPGSTKWETKIDPNCESDNPSNCKMKCLVEIPPEFKIVYVVTDTAIVKDYEIKTIEKKKLENTKAQWLEVMCESQLTQNFYKNLQHKLLKINYLNAYSSTFSKTEIKESFIQYQIDNDLPNGHFFIATLTHIGL